MEFNRIIVSKNTYILSINQIKKLLKQAGIKKKPLISNCVKKCKCISFNITPNDLHISFELPLLKQWNFTFRRRLLSGLHWIFFNSPLFFDEFYHNYGVCAYPNVIEINVASCINSNYRRKNILNTLKHEIMHLKVQNHCNHKVCAFHEGGGECKSINLCSKCQRIYKKILNGINHDT